MARRAKGKGRMVRKRPRGTAGFTRNTGLYGKFKRTGELKFFDGVVDYAGTPGADGDQTGTVIQSTLVEIKQGTTPSMRIGRKVFVKRCQVRGEFKLAKGSSAATTEGIRVRMILYCDKQCNGSAAQPGQILQSTDPSKNSTPETGAFPAKPITIDNYRNMEFIDRFRIVHDKTYTINRLNLEGSNASTDTYKQFNFGKNMNLECIYNGTDGSLSELQSNNLGLMIITDKDNVADFLKTKLQWRIRYTD